MQRLRSMIRMPAVAVFLSACLCCSVPGAKACMLQEEIETWHIDAAEAVFRGRIVSYETPGRFGSVLRFKVTHIYKGKIRRNARVIWHYSSVEMPADIDDFRNTYGEEHVVGLGTAYANFWNYAPPIDQLYHLYEKHLRGAQWVMPTPCAPPFIVKLEDGQDDASGIEAKLRDRGLVE